MVGKSAALSLHKCIKCGAKIFSACANVFEDTPNVLCRRCVPNSSDRRPKPNHSDSDTDDVLPAKRAKTARADQQSTALVTRKHTRPKKAAAHKASSVTAVMLNDEVDYHECPHLLFTSHVHR